MVDISELGGDSEKGRPFPAFKKAISDKIADDFAPLRKKSALEEAAEKLRRPSILDSAVEKLALGGLASSAARKIEDDLLASRQAVEGLLGCELDQYRKSQEHLRDVLGYSTMDEFKKGLGGPEMTNERETFRHTAHIGLIPSRSLTTNRLRKLVSPGFKPATC